MLQHRGGQQEGALSGEFGLAALQLAHGFGDNAAPSDVLVGGVSTILASVTVTPRVTGKFHVTCTVNISNDNEIENTFLIGVGHGSPLVLPVDYTKGSPLSVPGNAVVSDSITVEYGSGPLVKAVFPIGVPVTIDLVGFASATGLSLDSAHDAQITVEELPN